MSHLTAGGGFRDPRAQEAGTVHGRPREPQSFPFKVAEEVSFDQQAKKSCQNAVKFLKQVPQ